MGKKLFKSKKDQSDFFIALCVIGLFLWLFYGKIFNKNSLLSNSTDSKLVVKKDRLIPIHNELSNEQHSSLNSFSETEKQSTKQNTNRISKQELKHTNTIVEKGNGISIDSLPEAIVSIPQVIEETPKHDSDKDGILDDDDKCPFTKGVKENFGCPADRDYDGINDDADRCPDQAGAESNDGCPELQLEDKELKIIQEAILNVQFQAASNQLTKNSFLVLDKIADLMRKYPKARLKINGHTDSKGDDSKNLELSKARANSCKIYLTNTKGISKHRILTYGYGETQPKATNDTEEGQKLNRRVEFDLNY